MILELIKAAALLLALSLLQDFIARFWRNRETLKQLFSGVLFGGICVIGMMLPIEIIPGVIFDPRSVVLAMAGLFGGPLVSGITAAIAGGFRLWLGGGGVYVGVSVVIACSLLGLAYRYGVQRGWLKVNFSGLLLFGFIVHIVEVLLFTQLPEPVVEKVMNSVALPLILTFTPATAFLGMLLKDIENRIKIESALEESETQLSLHLQNTPLAAISWDTDFRCTQWNNSAEKIFGYSKDEALGKHGVGLVVAEQFVDEVNQVFSSLLAQKGGIRNVNENITRDGRTIFCEWFNTPIVNAQGQVTGIASLCEDITEKRRAEDEIKLKNTLLITQQETSIDGIFAIDDAGNIISINHRFFELWGLSPDITRTESVKKILQLMLNKLVDPDLFQGVKDYLQDHYEEAINDEVVLKDGRIFESYSAPMFGQEDQYFGRVWWFRDITARKQSEELIWKQANFDKLTGLANRQMLHDRLNQEIKKAYRANQRVALLYLDLDQFKDVNDTLGHHVGDSLLVETANRLSSYVRDFDTVARLGGDEFTIIMGGLVGTHNVERVANTILTKLAEPFHLEHEKIYISTSIGITFYPEDASEPDEMIKNADQAMYAAKKKGRNCFQYFTPSMQQAALSRMSMIKDMRAALPGKQFELYYQPIVELASGDIHKGEALLRWQHPERGMVSPDQFIPVAEETRMIMEIGNWVFHEAVRQTMQWRSSCNSEFQVSINTSPVQYLNEDFSIQEWLTHLESLGQSGQAIIAVEITEGLLMESMERITDKLLMFRDAGVQVSLDDFGTGYSSLSYLKKFDIDYLKIDRSFVQNLHPGGDDMALCEAIIVMAHKLGLKVIAEGIETSEQKELLFAAGCDYGQGYLFSRPVPANEFEQLLMS